MNQQVKCQLIILTGYLGSGKTSFISNLLQSVKDIPIAVIQNEFTNEMGIEQPLIQDADGNIFDKFYELPNGCICCSAKGELMTAIDYFLKTKKNIKYIIVESNGIADPSQLIKELWIDDGLDMGIQLHSVITIVPSHRAFKLWEDLIFQKQLLFSDLIILNFQEKTEENTFKELISTFEELNPLATIIGTNYSKVDSEVIFQLKHQQDNSMLKIDQQQNQKCQSQFQSLFIKFDLKKTYEDWERVIGGLLWDEQYKIARIKGILIVDGSQFAHSLQGVEDVFEIIETKQSHDVIKDNLSKILIVGQQLDPQQIINFVNKS